ncbi:hypothetical protein HK105_203502 [Polyrhizophydium stewartii]|uniref:UBR-type domain-containing protein n=1 Tax=Polyrhizophydium stewartii TaxID=2732419 RepID=A0ABR4NC24_9FUNG
MAAHGNVSRSFVKQKVYSCRTCAAAVGGPVGVCYGCFVSCHTTHDVVELFDCRGFRCDCGTARLAAVPCELDPKGTKAGEFNDAGAAESSADVESRHLVPHNSYNHNFDGVFCVCREVYDPDREEGTMFQCVACQDWFHDRCIGEMPGEDDFEEFVCSKCASEHAFLMRYAQDARMFVRKAADADDAGEAGGIRTPSVAAGSKRALDAGGADPGAGSDSTVCSMPEGGDGDSAEGTPPRNLFAVDGWRERICKCSACADMYRRHRLGFLVDAEATFQPPPDADAGKSLLDAGMQQLNEIDRVRAIDGIRAYNKFKDRLMEFLRGFGSEGKVVCKEDIERFFEEQNEMRRKRMRR